MKEAQYDCYLLDVWCWTIEDPAPPKKNHYFHKLKCAMDQWALWWKGFFNLQWVLPRTISAPSTCRRSKCVNCNGPMRFALLISCNADDNVAPLGKGAVLSSPLTAAVSFISTSASMLWACAVDDSVLVIDCTTSDWLHSLLYSRIRVSSSWPSWIAFGILCKNNKFIE